MMNQLIAIVIYYVLFSMYSIESTNLYNLELWQEGRKSNNNLKTILFCLPVLVFLVFLNFKQ